MPFVKLDCGIIDSSLWVESSDTRVVFMTMLAMCDQTGLVEATAPGIARRANIEVEKVRRCLAVLEAPDQDDKSGVDEGRRIKRIAGGYVITNYLNYRNKDYTANERKRRQRERERLEMSRRDTGKCHTTSRRDNATCHTTVTQAEAEAEAEVQKKNVRLLRKPDHFSPESRGVLHLLNETTGRQFRESNSSLEPIEARLKEDGVTVEGVHLMVKRQCAMWKDDPKMCEYLRPSTLFGKQKFNEYYAAKDLPILSKNNGKPEPKTLSQQQLEADNRRIDRLVNGK